MLISFCLIGQSAISQSQGQLPNDPNSKQVNFRYLDNEDGLSQNTVISIAQDSSGYLWIATRSGLNRYNGKNFKYYNKQFQAFDKGKGKQIGVLYVDRQDELWAITQSGGKLEKYNKEKDRFYDVKNFNSVVNVFQDTNLNFYISNYDGTVYKINNNTKDTTLVHKQADGFFVNHFLQVKDSIYMSTYNAIHSLSIHGGNGKQLHSNSSKNGFLTSDKQETVWLGTLGNGLYYKNISDKAFHPANDINKQLPSDLYILSLLVDEYNRLWVSTLKTGIFIFDLKHNTLEKLKFQKGNLYAIVDNEIICSYEDRNGVIWIGTNTSGLAYYDQYLSKFNVITSNQVPEDVNVDVILTITTDNFNNLFLGTLDGLVVYNKVTMAYNTINPNNSELLTKSVYAMLYTDNELWVATGSVLGMLGGINIFGKKNSSETYESNFKVKLNVGWTNQIFKDTFGTVWIATSNGLLKFDKSLNNKTDHNYDNDFVNGIPNVAISCIIEDSNQTIWVSTYDNHGIYTIDLNTGEINQKVTGFVNIKSIFKDRLHENILWIGTNGYGLFAYNIKTKTSENFSISNGLADNVIYGILSDDYHNLWLSTNRGITKLKYHKKGEIDIENFGLNDGLQSLEFNTNAYFKNKSGVMYFGGLKGLNWFKPENITKNPNIPKTLISRVNVLDKPIDPTAQITFKDDQNTISFYLESLNFSKPGGNIYKYRLVNYDSNWTESGNNNFVRYINLPPNDYVFEAMSANYDGAWNKKPATYSFTILKPWYLTNLAMILYGLLFLMAIYGLYSYFKWRWHIKMELTQEQNEKQRLKKLDEVKNRLYTNISHEIRTPLTLISGPVENQLSKKDLTDEDKIELTLIKKSSDRLLNLVNQMLDLSKLESGNLKLMVSKGNVKVFLLEIMSFFEFKAKERGLRLSYSINCEESAWFDRDSLEKIISNLLSNAVKYSSKNGEIRVTAQQQDHHLIFSVINHTTILNQKELSKIFDRFYQADNTSDGAGIGLSQV